MSPQHKGVRILAVIGLVIGLAAVGWVARQALHSLRSEHSGVTDVVTTRVSTNPAPDPGLLRLRQQAGEVLTGRPSRLARQMPGATPQLVAWLERWEQRTDVHRSDSAFLDALAQEELYNLVIKSDLNAWDMTRLCRAMTVLKEGKRVTPAWVAPIVDAAARDLARLSDHPAERIALAEQVHRAIDPIIWATGDMELSAECARLLANHLLEDSPAWQWMATGAATAYSMNYVRSRDPETLRRLKAEIESLWSRDLSSWRLHQLAELDYLTAKLCVFERRYEQGVEHARRASETEGYHHGAGAAILLSAMLLHLDRFAESDEIFVQTALRYKWHHEILEISSESVERWFCEAW